MTALIGKGSLLFQPPGCEAGRFIGQAASVRAAQWFLFGIGRKIRAGRVRLDNLLCGADIR